MRRTIRRSNHDAHPKEFGSKHSVLVKRAHTEVDPEGTRGEREAICAHIGSATCFVPRGEVILHVRFPWHRGRYGLPIYQ